MRKITVEIFNYVEHNLPSLSLLVWVNIQGQVQLTFTHAVVVNSLIGDPIL